MALRRTGMEGSTYHMSISVFLPEQIIVKARLFIYTTAVFLINVGSALARQALKLTSLEA